MKHTHLRKIITVIALILVMAFIFRMSVPTRDVSDGMSRQVCAVVCQVFVQDYEALSAAERESLFSDMEFWVRKGAHCLEYMVLGILLYLTADTYAKRIRRPFWVSIAAGMIYAAGDELHQHFVPGRNCELRDVMIDSLGVFIGAAAALMVTAWRKKKANQRGDYYGSSVKHKPHN